MKQEQLPVQAEVKPKNKIVDITGKIVFSLLLVILLIGGAYMALSQGVQAKVRQADAVRDQMYYHIQKAKELREAAAEQERLAAGEGEKLEQIKKELPISLCLEDSKNCPRDFLQR